MDCLLPTSHPFVVLLSCFRTMLLHLLFTLSSFLLLLPAVFSCSCSCPTPRSASDASCSSFKNSLEHRHFRNGGFRAADVSRACRTKCLFECFCARCRGEHTCCRGDRSAEELRTCLLNQRRVRRATKNCAWVDLKLFTTTCKPNVTGRCDGICNYLHITDRDPIHQDRMICEACVCRCCRMPDDHEYFLDILCCLYC